MARRMTGGALYKCASAARGHGAVWCLRWARAMTQRDDATVTSCMHSRTGGGALGTSHGAIICARRAQDPNFWSGSLRAARSGMSTVHRKAVRAHMQTRESISHGTRCNPFSPYITCGCSLGSYRILLQSATFYLFV